MNIHDASTRTTTGFTMNIWRCDPNLRNIKHAVKDVCQCHFKYDMFVNIGKHVYSMLLNNNINLILVLVWF